MIARYNSLTTAENTTLAEERNPGSSESSSALSAQLNTVQQQLNALLTNKT